MYKLLSIDLDGTVLDDAKRLSERNIRAISSLREKGILLSLATGRGLKELENLKPLTDAADYGILSSGSSIYDFRKKEYVYKHVIDDSIILKCLELSQREKAMPFMLTDHEAVALREQLKDVSVYKMGDYQENYDKVCTPVDSLYGFLRDNPQSILKLCIYHLTPESRINTRKALDDIKDELFLCDTEITSLEITMSGCDKGETLIKLCKFAGITPGECAAVGDSLNDIAMLKVAGLSVAVGNTSEEVKKASDRVVASNNEDGVAEVIERFL